MYVPLLKKCNYIGCNANILVTEKYCYRHKGYDKEKYIEYSKRRTDKREASFYNSKEWKELRDYIMHRQFGLDILEWSKGNIVKAETYHHIIEVKDDWELRLNEDNIIGLSYQNHRNIHMIMNNGDKEKVQEQLKVILKNFYSEYYD